MWENKKNIFISRHMMGRGSKFTRTETAVVRVVAVELCLWLYFEKTLPSRDSCYTVPTPDFFASGENVQQHPRLVAAPHCTCLDMPIKCMTECLDLGIFALLWFNGQSHIRKRLEQYVSSHDIAPIKLCCLLPILSLTWFLVYSAHIHHVNIYTWGNKS